MIHNGGIQLAHPNKYNPMRCVKNMSHCSMEQKHLEKSGKNRKADFQPFYFFQIFLVIAATTEKRSFDYSLITVKQPT